MFLRLYRMVFGFALASLVLISSPHEAQAQTAEPSSQIVLENLESALSSGDATDMLTLAAHRIAITLFGASKYYSRDQAKFVLEDFFQAHPPTPFSFGAPRTKEGHVFASGVYRSEQSDTPLYVYVRLQYQADAWHLREIRIQRQPFR